MKAPASSNPRMPFCRMISLALGIPSNNDNFPGDQLSYGDAFPTPNQSERGNTWRSTLPKNYGNEVEKEFYDSTLRKKSLIQGLSTHYLRDTTTTVAD
ncbi:MAG: hypothetical protein IPJ40_20290 [Saprospirales bacterium]|nr:hypothetical protein [Saprospirales bacterium]